MKKLINIFIVIALVLSAALLTPILIDNPGFVHVQFAGYNIKMRFIVAFGLVVAAGLMFLLVVYLMRLPKKAVLHFSSNRSRKSFAKGLLALSEGHWKHAEKLLIISTKNSPTPELGFMAAARAAIAQNKIKVAFDYLDEAETHTDNPLTVDLTRCELWVKTGENKQAISLLNRVLESYPNNPRALNIMAQASQNAEQWQQLRDVLPKVQKLKIFSSEKVQQLSHHSIVQQLTHADTEAQLQATWNSLDKRQKIQCDYIHAYAQTGLKLGLFQQVAQLTESALSKNFSDELLSIWGQLNIEIKDKIKIAEKWLKQNPDNVELLKTLGQLCLENKRWAKAQAYLEKSLVLKADASTFKLMASYFDAVGEPDNALQAYRQAENSNNQLAVINE